MAEVEELVAFLELVVLLRGAWTFCVDVVIAPLRSGDWVVVTV